VNSCRQIHLFYQYNGGIQQKLSNKIAAAVERLPQLDNFRSHEYWVTFEIWSLPATF
jgi:hypothetical protein